MERARGGDVAAWEALYRRAYPRLFAYARRRVATADEARDAVSETMTRAVAGLERFRGDGAGFDAWLYGILRHVVRDIHRKARRQAVEPLGEHAAEAGTPLDHVLHDEEATQLRAAFARLRPADRELLELRVVAGLSSDQVAAVLGRRAGAVRMAQVRALDRLRALLREEGVGVD